MKIYNLLCILSYVIIISSCGMKSIEDMKINIEYNSPQIKELKEYFTNIVPPQYLVRIQFNSSKNIDLFVYESIKDSTKREKLFEQWNVDLENYKETPQTEYEKKYGGNTKSLELVKRKLNWNQEVFDKLYKKLENANCIGICNRKPIEIEYGFNGMALLSFLVFDENLTPDQQEEFSDDCMQMFYKDNFVLKYGSGATGSLCTPEFKRKR